MKKTYWAVVEEFKIVAVMSTDKGKNFIMGGYDKGWAFVASVPVMIAFSMGDEIFVHPNIENGAIIGHIVKNTDGKVIEKTLFDPVDF